MKMAVYHGIRDLRVEEIEEPKPGPNEAKVKVKYCGICGSDLHEYLHGLFPQSPFGHEACGEIVEVGHQVEGFQVGDRVMAFEKDAYAEYMVCPQERMIKIPEEMSWKRAAAVEPLAGAAYAIERGGIEPGNTVMISGAGPVGLTLLLGLKAIGAKTVYMTEISEVRRKKAEELGAASVFNPMETRISARIKELTAGRGVDVVDLCGQRLTAGEAGDDPGRKGLGENAERRHRQAPSAAQEARQAQAGRLARPPPRAGAELRDLPRRGSGHRSRAPAGDLREAPGRLRGRAAEDPRADS